MFSKAGAKTKERGEYQCSTTTVVDDLAKAHREEKCSAKAVGLHCPVSRASITYTDGSRLEDRQRCKVCSTHINTYYEQCDVALCFGDYSEPIIAALSSITCVLRCDS